MQTLQWQKKAIYVVHGERRTANRVQLIVPIDLEQCFK